MSTITWRLPCKHVLKKIPSSSARFLCLYVDSKSPPRMDKNKNKANPEIEHRKMGGKAAKERRRLLRESKQPTQSPKPATLKRGRAKFEPKSGFHSFKSAASPGATGKKGQVQNKKFKVKKPKHLKRKLESVEDENEKEEVLKQITKFEQKKSELSCHNPHGKRFQSNREQSSSREGIAKAEIAQNARKQTDQRQRSTLAVVNGAGKEADAIKDVKINPRDQTFHGKESVIEEDVKTSQGAKRRRGRKDSNREQSREGIVKAEVAQITRKHADQRQKNTVDVATAVVPGVLGNEVDAMKDEKTETSDQTDHDMSSDEESAIEDVVETRQRGKRRRGRKDTSKIIEETKEDNDRRVTSEVPTESKTGSKDQLERYCKGRKPVTDFEVGRTYSGKVVYSKPFGIFVDIGCHSDAFCHVSRCQDDYVESAENLYTAGEEVKVRIIEVERSRKRITVSMQSENRLEDEKKSIQARQERRDRFSKANKKQKTTDRGSVRTDLGARTTLKPDAATVVPVPRTIPSKPESEMTPAELKRARKLARRAARREADETTSDQDVTLKQ